MKNKAPAAQQAGLTDALAREILEICRGWSSATFGWQGDDPDGFAKSSKAHDDECVRRINCALASFHTTPTEQDDLPLVELWHGERKVTVYKDVVLRIWGAHIEDEMSDAPRTYQSVQEAIDWLYAPQAPVQQNTRTVPLEPTADMLDAGCDVDARGIAEAENLKRFPDMAPWASAGQMLAIQYRAMLNAAAPQQDTNGDNYD
jgi:hypothetical protein